MQAVCQESTKIPIGAPSLRQVPGIGPMRTLGFTSSPLCFVPPRAKQARERAGPGTRRFFLRCAPTPALWGGHGLRPGLTRRGTRSLKMRGSPQGNIAPSVPSTEEENSNNNNNNNNDNDNDNDTNNDNNTTTTTTTNNNNNSANNNIYIYIYIYIDVYILARRRTGRGQQQHGDEACQTRPRRVA